MKSYLSNETGFSAVEIVLAIAAVVAIGVAAYYGFKAHDLATNNKTSSSTASPIPSASPTLNATTKPTASPVSALPNFVFDIADLGVQFSAPGAFTGLTYQTVHLSGDQAVNSVELSTKALTTAACPITSAPLGYLTVDSDKGGQKVATARNTAYYYIAPTGACAASNYSSLQTSLQTLVTNGKN